MTLIKLSTPKSLGTFLNSVIEESVKAALHNKALQEKEKQAAGTGGSTDNSGGDSGGTTDVAKQDNSGGDSGAPTPSKTMDDESEKLKGGNIEPKDIIDKLNSIRSGKSFKDDHVSSAMDEYINSLSKEEKIALLSFVKGIAQIVTGEIPAQQAQDPSDKPSDIQMQKGNPKQVKHVDPNVIKSQTPKKKQGEEENTEAPKAGPPPITAKKR